MIGVAGSFLWVAKPLAFRRIVRWSEEKEGNAALITKRTDRRGRRTVCKYPNGLPGSAPGCRTGNGEKLSRTQAEPVQAIKSAVAYFPSISGATSWRRSRYRLVQKKGTVLINTSLACPAVAGCNRAETFSRLSTRLIKFRVFQQN